MLGSRFFPRKQSNSSDQKEGKVTVLSTKVCFDVQNYERKQNDLFANIRSDQYVFIEV